MAHIGTWQRRPKVQPFRERVQTLEEATRCSWPTASVLIVDDVTEWRVLVRKMLEKEPGWQIVAEACDGFQAIQRAGELHPDLILLDIGMPVLNGIEAAAHIKQISPQSKVVFLTQETDADIRLSVLANGAKGYVLKANSATELLPAMDAALDGHLSETIF